MDNEQTSGGYSSGGGYGFKGGWKKWIWIYLIIAIVVYGGIYLYYHNKNSDTSGQTNNIY